MAVDSFWDNREAAQKMVEECSGLRKRIDPLCAAERQLGDLQVMAERYILRHHVLDEERTAAQGGVGEKPDDEGTHAPDSPERLAIEVPSRHGGADPSRSKAPR